MLYAYIDTSRHNSIRVPAMSVGLSVDAQMRMLALLIPMGKDGL